MSHSAPQNKSQLKFLLDENIDVRIASVLKERGFSTVICPKGLKNGEVIQLAQKESCVLLTNDNDFTNTDVYNPSSLKGVVVFRIHPPKLTKATSALKKLFMHIRSHEFAGRLFIVTEIGIEVISYTS